MYVSVCWHVSGGSRTICENQFCAPTMCIPGIELRLLGLLVSAFTYWVISPALNILFSLLGSFYEYECLAWMYECAPAACGCQKRMLYSLALELRTVVSHQVSVGNWTLIEQQMLLTPTLSILIMKSFCQPCSATLNFFPWKYSPTSAQYTYPPNIRVCACMHRMGGGFIYNRIHAEGDVRFFPQLLTL